MQVRPWLGRRHEGSPPLRPEHLPDPATIDQPVSLSALTHLRGVNALAPDQTLTFGPALTIVYGANAAGKSGYTRILKRACRARGAEEILGNVVSGTLPKRPSARIVCEKNGQREEYRWNDDQPPNPLLSQVSVFDHHCASVYVAKKTDVAYRPLGLDLFDQLAAVCDGVARILEKERRALESVTPSLPQFPPNTQPAKLLHRLTSLTDPFSVIQLARLSEADEERIHTILRALADLRSDAPLKRARELELHLNRVQSLAQELNMLSQASSSEVVSALFSAKSSQQDTKVLLDDMNRRVFIAQPLPNTGSQAWHNLWNAAKQYSAHDAYPSPHINSLSRDPGRDAYFASKNCNNLRRTDSFTSKRRTSLRYNGNTIVPRIHTKLGSETTFRPTSSPNRPKTHFAKLNWRIDLLRQRSGRH